ncbi:MAG: glycosyltransferase, partial [Anaerolineae bacterium]|nr:glycosyltransferase [Anaerolineae bacterium]
MPVRNEAGYIARSLGAVLAQDYPPERMEVLVVDGMSEDGTPEIVRAMAHNPRGIRVLLLDNPARIVPAALNKGLCHARGEVIVRVDGHCEIARDYIQRCVETLSKTKADNVGGVCETVAETFMARAIAVAQSSPFGIGNVAFRTRRPTPGFVDTV